MKIYLTGNKGSDTAFKITTARIYSSLDSFIEDAMNRLTERGSENAYYNKMQFIDYISSRWSGLRVYVTELDCGNNVKKLNKEMWKEAIGDFVEKYPDKIAKFELSRREI